MAWMISCDCNLQAAPLFRNFSQHSQQSDEGLIRLQNQIILRSWAMVSETFRVLLSVADSFLAQDSPLEAIKCLQAITQSSTTDLPQVEAEIRLKVPSAFKSFYFNTDWSCIASNVSHFILSLVRVIHIPSVHVATWISVFIVLWDSHSRQVMESTHLQLSHQLEFYCTPHMLEPFSLKLSLTQIWDPFDSLDDDRIVFLVSAPVACNSASVGLLNHQANIACLFWN